MFARYDGPVGCHDESQIKEALRLSTQFQGKLSSNLKYSYSFGCNAFQILNNFYFSNSNRKFAIFDTALQSPQK